MTFPLGDVHLHFRNSQICKFLLSEDFTSLADQEFPPQIHFSKEEGLTAKIDFETRIIHIRDQFSEDKRLELLVLEIFNLLKQAQFLQARENGLEFFVRNWERLEHESILSAKNLLQKHNLPHIFLSGFSENFKLHYLMQQASGHTDLPVRAFGKDPFHDFQGTWPHPFENLEQRRTIFELAKALLKSSNYKKALHKISKSNPGRVYSMLSDNQTLITELKRIKKEKASICSLV